MAGEGLHNQDDLRRIDEVLSQLAQSLDEQVVLIYADELLLPHASVFDTWLEHNVLRRDTTLIVSGNGGNTTAALTMALALRQRLQDHKITCMVPKLAGSALGLFAMLSDRLLVTKESSLSQMDILLHGRRVTDIMRDKDSSLDAEVQRAAKWYYGYLGRLTTAIRAESPIYETPPLQHYRAEQSIVGKNMDKLMRAPAHDATVNWRSLKQCGIRHTIVAPEWEPWRHGLELVSLAESHLTKTQSRIFIHRKAPQPPTSDVEPQPQHV